jgi:hypothetical protein
MSPIPPSKPLECNLIINKINMNILINSIFFMRKFKILGSISLILLFYKIKTLCPHVKHNLFYLWLRYEAIWTKIVILVDSFSIELHNETQFLNRVLGHLRTCSNHINHTTTTTTIFYQNVCEYLMNYVN